MPPIPAAAKVAPMETEIKAALVRLGEALVDQNEARVLVEPQG